MTADEWRQLMVRIDGAAKSEFRCDGRDRNESFNEWLGIPREQLQWWLW